MVPATYKFAIPWLWNPRTVQATSPFLLSIYDMETHKEIYIWDPKYAVTVNGQAVTDGSIT
jgi:hypothetical protein